MANVIQIKKSAYGGTTPPSGTGGSAQLAYGELGWLNNNGSGGKLYIGGKDSSNSGFVADIQQNIINAIPDADDDGSTKGLAAFDNDDFNATSGVVTLATTSTAAELNILDGATLDVNELNILDGVTATTAQVNQIAVAAGNAVANKALVVDGNKDIAAIRNLSTTGNVSVGGTLTVVGSTTSIDSTIVEVGDISIALAKDNTADVSDIGFYGKYVDSGTKYTGLFRDASDGDGVWKFYDSITVAPHEGTGVVGVGTSGYSLGDLSTNLVSSVIDCDTWS
jgi:hypothetical protein